MELEKIKVVPLFVEDTKGEPAAEPAEKPKKKKNKKKKRRLSLDKNNK